MQLVPRLVRREERDARVARLRESGGQTSVTGKAPFEDGWAGEKVLLACWFAVSLKEAADEAEAGRSWKEGEDCDRERCLSIFDDWRCWPVGHGACVWCVVSGCLLTSA